MTAVRRIPHFVGTEMLAKARENAHKSVFSNVEFRFGEIEAVPVSDETVDVIISNCVINLSPEKQRVFTEAYRVLKPGEPTCDCDVVATAARTFPRSPEKNQACV